MCIVHIRHTVCTLYRQNGQADVRQHKLRSARWVEGQRGSLSAGAAAADVAVGPAAGVPPAGGGKERLGVEGGGEAAAGGSAPVEELTFVAMQQVCSRAQGARRLLEV